MEFIDHKLKPAMLYSRLATYLSSRIANEFFLSLRPGHACCFNFEREEATNWRSGYVDSHG